MLRRRLGAEQNVVLTENRDGKLVQSIHPKIGGRLRLAHEQNQQISITAEIIKYDENLAVWRSFRSLSTDSALRWRVGSS